MKTEPRAVLDITARRAYGIIPGGKQPGLFMPGVQGSPFICKLIETAEDCRAINQTLGLTDAEADQIIAETLAGEAK